MANNFRETLSCAPEAVFRCLPRMGRVMLTSRVPGVTHERMGAVESVVTEQGQVRCGGAAHDAVIDPSAIRSIIVDRTGRMKEQALPRIDFMGEGDAFVIGVVGLDGLEVFDAALAGAGGRAAHWRKPRSRRSSNRLWPRTIPARIRWPPPARPACRSRSRCGVPAACRRGAAWSRR